MDFMKVFDQTVREIKREVNLKVLKVPEIEQKVLDATDDEPWGPHGTALAEIAQATKKFSECQMALTVIEYLVANGSERAVDDIIEHTFQISSLTSFEYVEPSGKDMGINVRKKAETIVSLLNDKDKIQEVRDKAAATRDKYFGLSSSGVTYKSGSASLGSSSFQSSIKSGGFGGTSGSDTFGHKDKDEDQYGEEKFEKFVPKSRQETSEKKKTSNSTNQELPTSRSSKQSTKDNKTSGHNAVSQPSSVAPSSQLDEEDNDFDPRGTSKRKPAGESKPEKDLFGQSLFDDLLDAPVPVTSVTNSADVDLFADASFVSVTPKSEVASNSGIQPSIDLFASAPASSAPVTSTIDFFAAPTPDLQPSADSTATSNLNSQDPFAAVPLNKFDGSDLFGAFTSDMHSSSSQPIQKPTTVNGNSIPVPVAPQKEDNFQIKSGIWADSLSRGLIDLNISAPKKMSLADVGVVGGLNGGSDEKQKAPQATYYMGRAMGSGTGGLGTGMSSSSPPTAADDIFSNFSSQQYQFGGFQK
ncbi:Clathrin interactor EPSIN 1-like protein [Drosera capensis]